MTLRELFNENKKNIYYKMELYENLIEEIKKFYRIKYDESKTISNNNLIYLQIEDNHNLFSLDN